MAGGKNRAVDSRLVRLRASKATRTVSRTVSSGKSVAAWKLRPRPWRARADAERQLAGPGLISPDPVSYTHLTLPTNHPV